MIKVLNQYFPGRLFVLVLTENVLILCGIWAAVAYNTGSVTLSLLGHPAVFGKIFLITAVCQICLYYADIYDLRSIGSKLEVLMRVLQALGVAALILASIFYVIPEVRLGEGIVEMSLIGIVLVILSWRILIEWLNRAYGAGERILLVGAGAGVHKLTGEIRKRPDLPLTIVGAVAEEGMTAAERLPGVETVGNLDELGKIMQDIHPDRVIIALKERRLQLPIDLLLHYRMRGVLIEDSSALYQKLTGKVPVESINPSSLIFTDGFSQSAVRKTLGRVVGFFVALVGSVILGPLMLLVAICIKLESKGPALYRQVRVGKNGKDFEVFKFRSMRQDAEAASGPVWASASDPRVTKVGRLLRKLRFDELPQLINVLRGDMAFVGPRPERPHFVKQLKEQIPFYDLRHSVRPGITGWAQVSMHYGATVEDSLEKLEYDLFYIKNNSFSFDGLILFQTIKIMLFGRGAR